MSHGLNAGLDRRLSIAVQNAAIRLEGCLAEKARHSLKERRQVQSVRRYELKAIGDDLQLIGEGDFAQLSKVQILYFVFCIREAISKQELTIGSDSWIEHSSIACAEKVRKVFRLHPNEFGNVLSPRKGRECSVVSVSSVDGVVQACHTDHVCSTPFAQQGFSAPQMLGKGAVEMRELSSTERLQF
jgi:hypothetical protein